MVLGHLDIHLVKKYIIRPLLHTPNSIPASPLHARVTTLFQSFYTRAEPWTLGDRSGLDSPLSNLHRRLTSQQATPIVETSVANGASKGCQGAHCQLSGKGWSGGLSGGGDACSKAERNGLAGMGLPDKVRAEGGSGRCKGTEPGSFRLGQLAS